MSIKTRTRDKREKRSARKDTYAVTGILACVFCLVFRIPLFYLTGERGVGYFSMANELYLFLGCMIAGGLSEATASLVRYRMKREQYASAHRVLKGGLLLGGIVGGLFSVLFLLAGQLYAEKVIRMPLAGLSINMMAPAIVFQVLTGVIKGYFQGNGSRVPAMHSKILETVFLFCGGLLGGALLHGYGEKVSALLQHEDYAAAYGAFGASIGILSASVLCFLHMVFLLFIFLKKGRKQSERELQNSHDKGFHIAHMLLGTAAPYSLFALAFQSMPFLDGIFFNGLYSAQTDTVTLWGNYYGKYLVVLGLLCAVASLFTLEPVRRIVFLTDREEYRSARERLALAVHQVAMLTFPAAVFAAVLSENILDVLFRGNNGSTAVWVMSGSVIILLYPFSYLFSSLLIRFRKMKYVIGYGLLAIVLHVVLVVILLENTGLGILSVILGTIAFYAVTAVAGFLLVCKCVSYQQEWIRSIAVPAVVSGITGLMLMLLNKAVAPLTGTELSLLICLPVGAVVYLVLLIVARGVKERELEEMAGGRLLIMLGKLMHFM